METPLSLRLLELRPKLIKRAKVTGMSQADLVRLGVFLVLTQCKTTAQLYQAQASFKAKGVA